MNPSKRNFVYTTPRHYRALFFVEKQITITQLREILYANLRTWGGRYNPIIPIENNQIDSYYIELIRHLDPDVIYYSENVDPEIIKKTGFFNSVYEKLDDQPSYHFGGVDYHFLLSESNKDFLPLHEKLAVLHVQGIWQIDIKAKGFYQLNTALFDLYANQDRLIRGFEVLPITKSNHLEINKIIAEKRPYFKSILSQLKKAVTIFRPKDFQLNQFFELIISDDKISNSDYFYFWNRQQYIERNHQLYQMIVTKEELALLFEDPDFESVLYRLQVENHISIVSNTIPKSELAAIKSELRNRFKHVRFETREIKSFPYDILDFRYSNDLKKDQRKQIFSDERDLLRIEIPKLRDGIELQGAFAIDIEIEEEGLSIPAKVRFPFSYPLYHARVNKSGNQSYFISHETNVIDFRIPSDFETFQSRLLNMMDSDGLVRETTIDHIQISNAGQRLSSLLNLFENNWANLMSYIDDKFWLDVFRYTSLFKNSNIPRGKGVFSHKDLITERRLLYEKYKESLEKNLKAENPNIRMDEYIEWAIKDDFELIDNHLQGLVNLGAAFIGIKVKCNKCGSNKWYSINEAGNKIPCAGCQNILIPRIETPYYYRVNEIIVNNLLSDATVHAKHFNGNYVVLQALHKLRTETMGPFTYTFPLDFAIRHQGNVNWISDIDILAIQNGKFILGEAKYDASEFKSKDIKNLIWLGNNIRPDKIILAYMSGKIADEKVQLIKDSLLNKSIEVIVYEAEAAWYMSGNLFGYP